MGRELRRVPLDLDAPIGKTWPGFLRPSHLVGIKCEECDGTGSSPEGRHLHALWYGYEPFRPEDNGSVTLTPDYPAVRAFAERQCGQSPGFYGMSEAAIVRNAQRLCDLWNAQWSHHLNQFEVDALVDEGRLMSFTHSRTPGKWEPTGYRPTAKEVNDWSLGGMGHDSINQWIVCKAVLDSRGQPSRCAVCDGDGEIFADDEHREAFESWEPTPPPEGPGYQMWETVSEGSPISPVFETDTELARWLGKHEYSDGNFDQWLRMIRGSGHAFSGVMVDGLMMTGVEDAGRLPDGEDE